MKFIKTHYVTIFGASMGAMAGFAYYYWIGCTSGSCPITSKPVNSMLYGALMGGFLFNMFKK